jgi:predicted O-methyltransferase YrrM
MDLTRIRLIQEAPQESLRDPIFLESFLPTLGFNKEVLHEQPEIVKQNGGGLLIWQYPNQFSKYLCLLQKYSISSYLEIGCRWGGTYVLTTEYLKRFQPITKSVAIDIIDSPVSSYTALIKEATFLKLSSQSSEFQDFLKDQTFDLIFIDGDHSYEGVKNDYEVTKGKGKIYVFHDIVSCMCPGVVKFWNELKQKEAAQYSFFEFVDQYDEVVRSTGGTFLGMGIAVSKSFA